MGRNEMENNEEKNVVDVEQTSSDSEKIEISENVSEEEVIEEQAVAPRHASSNEEKEKNG